MPSQRQQRLMHWKSNIPHARPLRILIGAPLIQNANARTVHPESAVRASKHKGVRRVAAAKAVPLLAQRGSKLALVLRHLLRAVSAHLRNTLGLQLRFPLLKHLLQLQVPLLILLCIAQCCLIFGFAFRRCLEDLLR